MGGVLRDAQLKSLGGRAPRCAVFLSLLSLFLFPIACSESSVCLDKLEAEVKRQCQTVKEDECRRLRRQYLEKIEVWDALTDEERARAEEQCSP